MKAQGKVALYLIIYIGTLLSGCKEKPLPPKAALFVDVLNPYTPVKDQGRNNTCWTLAMLAAIETTHISQGDSVHLSPYYAERAMLLDAAREAYLAQGHAALSTRGTAQRLLDLIGQYGIVPFDAYRHGAEANTQVLLRQVEAVARQEARGKRGLEACLAHAEKVIDETFGTAPNRVYMLGAEYTPQEFARSVCAPDEYEALTSFTHHPFYTSFALEVPDNAARSLFLNVPIDTLMARIDEAIANGQGVCWEGDTSEPGFSFGRGWAVLPRGADTSQQARQRAFERFLTTDDHCMALVGTGHTASGNRYYIAKNSWGKRNPYGGLMYLSAAYVRLKTIAVWLPRRK